jgi:hypothetical protein
LKNLAEDAKLKTSHTVIRLRYNDDAAKVTFAYIELESTSILSGKLASLNRSWHSNKGTFRASGMVGIEIIESMPS